MVQKHVLLSALSVGVGLGLGLASSQSQAVSKWTMAGEGITTEKIEMELQRLIVDGRDILLSFDDFPYYLSEQTRVLLKSAAFVHLKHLDVSKHTRNLSPASRTILLSGPAELYQQALAEALAQYFGAKLLLLDMNEFSRKLRSKYGNPNNESCFKRSISEATYERVSSFFGNLSIITTRDDNGGALFRQNSGRDRKSRGMEGGNCSFKSRRNDAVSSDMSSISSQASSNSAPLKENTSWPFDENVLLQTLFKVLNSYSESGRIIFYLRDVDRLILSSPRLYKLFEGLLKKLSGSVLVLGSRMLESDYVNAKADENLKHLFPYNIDIKPPEDENRLIKWKTQLEEDMKWIKFQDNKNHIAEVLAANDLDCDDLCSICQADRMVLSNYIEEIVMSAISHHLMNNSNQEYRNGKLLISSNSLSHGLSIFQEGYSCKDTLERETNADGSKGPESKAGNLRAENKNEAEKTSLSYPSATKPVEILPDNEFEKRIRPAVIPANEIGITFEDIGALEETKESLQELVMLPLQRPDLFKGGILKPCRGLLLFGPPGTGKTMRLQNEAGKASTVYTTNISKMVGEDEKELFSRLLQRFLLL
ncbi:hypothetical protein Leryth_016252 [Lithospermum erythrorhizon]|nr:hypothetical protein Leryth_016252 [Lithospermum erythrorhizon]